jgi:hypothetical protein
MTFKSELDTMLTPETSEALGRLLIEYQKLELKIRLTMGFAFQAVDPLGIIPDIFARDYTAKRRIEIARKILKLAAKRFRVADVEFKGTHIVGIYTRDEGKANQEVAVAFASLRSALFTAEEVLAYRNDLFHGDVQIEGDEIRFVGKEQKPIASEAWHFKDKRQEVFRAIFHLTMAATGVRVALTYLMQKAETGPSNSESVAV